eukprot:224374_1
MTSESEQQSILEQLEHLIFDEHKLVSYKWVTNYFKLHIQTSKQILSAFVDKHQSKLWTHYCITGYKSLPIPHSDSNTNNNNNSASSVFTLFIVSDQDLQSTKDSFDTITSIHIHSVATKQTQTVKDFYGAQYQADYDQQRDVMTKCLASHGSTNAPSVHNIATWSDITNNQVRGQSSPHLNRALGRTKQEEKQMNLKNKNEKKLSFKQKIDTINTNNTQTPLKAKFNNLQLQNEQKQESKPEPVPSNTNKPKPKGNKGGIAACFAKAASANNKQPKKPENDAQDPKPSKKKKADDITNFFGVQNGCKDKIQSKKISKPKKKTKKKKKKKAKKAKDSIEPARKRKRGEMEAENNLVPIDFDSESSESEHEMDVEIDEDDEELEQLTAFRRNGAKKRRIMDSDSDYNDEDDDIDLEQDSKAKPKKKTKRQLEKERQKEEKQKLLSQRKNNFFGKAAGNQLRKVKKYKRVTKTHVDENGMFITEDVDITDDESCEEKDTGNGNAMHKHQETGDEDVDMIDTAQTKKKKEAVKQKKKKVVKLKGKKKGGKKNGNITNFFKVK